MTSVNISLPEHLRSYIQERIQKGEYATVSEYIKDLVREDQDRRQQEQLEEQLLRGLDSGEPIELTDEFVNQNRQELLRRINQKKHRAA